MKKWTLHQTPKTVLSTITFLLLILTSSTRVHSAQISLSWNKPDDSRVTGYNIYCGISGTDFSSTPAQKITSPDQTNCVISGLVEGKTYSIAATSIDAGGNESDFSETITHTVLSPNDIDDDGDGYTENQGDFNDADASIYPGAVEICGDGIDQDCNGSDLICPEDIDDDGDGYTENQGDLNDADASVYPGAVEICGDGIDQDCNGSDLECVAASFLETGDIIVNHQWTFVPFTNSFNTPIVVAKMVTANDSAPAVVRVRNIKSDGFEVRIQEWDSLDGIHGWETVNYMVMEAGSHTLPDGTMVEAGKFDANNIHFVTFAKNFNTVPVVFCCVSTYNDTSAVTGRMAYLDLDGFYFQLQEQERNKDGHGLETVSYIAWEPSSGEVDGRAYEVTRTPQVVTDRLQAFAFRQPFAADPVCIADMQTRNEVDTASVQLRKKTVDGIDGKIAEEQSYDRETKHAAEVVGYLVIE